METNGGWLAAAQLIAKTNATGRRPLQRPQRADRRQKPLKIPEVGIDVDAESVAMRKGTSNLAAAGARDANLGNG